LCLTNGRTGASSEEQKNFTAGTVSPSASARCLLQASVWRWVGRCGWRPPGIPLPLALMAGYCTLVGAVYLAMAPLAYRVLRQTPFVTKPGEDNRPNYAAVRLQHQYSLGPASRLWVDLDPRAFATYDSQAWYETFVSAIQQGKLKFQPKFARYSDKIAYEKQHPDLNTTVTREEFKRYAASIGEDPAFLRDS
jgi:hypothetical protein